MTTPIVHGEASIAGGVSVHDSFMHALEYVVLAINGATVLVLVWGVVFGMITFFRHEIGRMSAGHRDEDHARIRRQVGFYLLFGLELLIAADVIETMIRPTLEQLAILGGVSLIRIVIGVALGRELQELSAGRERE